MSAVVLCFMLCFSRFLLILFFFFSLVEKTLAEVDPARRCFRSIGGVLVERTVKEVLPAITANKDQVRFGVGF